MEEGISVKWLEPKTYVRIDEEEGGVQVLYAEPIFSEGIFGVGGLDSDNVRVYLDEGEPIILPRLALSAMLTALKFVRLEDMTFWKNRTH